MLQCLQCLAALPAIEQYRAEPGFGIWVVRNEPAQVQFGSGEIAGTVGHDAAAQCRRDVGSIAGLGVRRRVCEEQRRQQRCPRCDHLVLKVKAAAAALAFSISSGFSSCPTCSSSGPTLGTFQRSAMATHL